VSDLDGSIALAEGDLVLIPHGRGHWLLDAPATRPVPLSQLLQPHPSTERPVLRHGGGGAATTLICGGFSFEQVGDFPLLSLLPPVIHIQGHQGRAAEWLQATLKLLAHETREERPGTETMLARLMDVMFIQAVRAWLESQPDGQGGWLGGLRDPQVGAVIELMHRAPDQSWTVATLAAAAAMSRSSLSARFKAVVGEPPLAHLTRWRMSLAASWLRDGELSLIQMAERVGYESEAAFSKAFKRHFGVAPGAYRRHARAA
jgi:AraC-like DNA-binding protein